MAKRPTVSLPILEYLAAHPNQTVTQAELMKALDFNRDQVRQGLSTIRSKKLPVVSMLAGGAWKYVPDNETVPQVQPPPVKTNEVFEYLATANNGDMIIQDVDGKLYRAKEL
jgi:hypothetical protein